MKNLILSLLVICSFTAFGQDQDDKDRERERQRNLERVKENRYSRNYQERDKNEIKTLVSNGHNGGFFGLTFKGTKFNDETLVTTGFRTGWIISRALGIGFEAHGVVPTAKFDQIAPPDRLVLLGGYGGLFLEPILFSNQVVHLTFPVAGGAGWFGYHQDWEGNYSNYSLVYDDVYWYLEPGVAVEINVSKNFRLSFGATQRFTQELELPGTPSDAFDNRNYFLTMKFGKF